MNAHVETSPQLGVEWERVVLLTVCAAQARGGKQLETELQAELTRVHAEVLLLRQTPAWAAMIELARLEPIDVDVLVCCLAPEAEPSLGWMYNELQPGVTVPYPTPALLRELLALDESESALLHRRLRADAPLRHGGLLQSSGTSGSFDPLLPTQKARELLLGWTSETALPGAIELHVPASLSFADLVISAHHRRALGEFLAWVRHREQVEREWGARAGGGPVALFAGPSGTGKSFAAKVLAAELGWQLFRVDLGLLVSKWVGETEKNLNSLFDAAEGQQLILLFDEADSLFGKRGNVRDARDRYANMEVGHLLSRLEHHRGPAILTTNLRNHLDPAFARRLQLVLDFPIPELDARTQLWAGGLPPRAPVDPAVDPRMLGAAVVLTGAQIHNACLHAAMLAYAAKQPIDLTHIARAIWVELGKDGREQLPSTLGPLAAFLVDDERRLDA